ncbi:restriction endonuclease subunit S, partial [Microbacterium sediminis]
MNRERMMLGDALELLIDHRGKTPKKLGGDWTTAGHRVVSALNIKGNRVDGNDHHYISDEMYRRWMKVPLRKGDVLLTSEAPTGEVAFVGDDVDWAIGQRLFALRGRPGLLDGQYLFYALRGGQLRDDMMSRTTGTTVQGIRQAELVRVMIELPPLPEQRAIAATLGALDDKIESNRRAVDAMNGLVAAEFERCFGRRALTLELGRV